MSQSLDVQAGHQSGDVAAPRMCRFRSEIARSTRSWQAVPPRATSAVAERPTFAGWRVANDDDGAEAIVCGGDPHERTGK